MVNYLDYAATTPVHLEVLEVITKEMSSFGNPSSVYRIGREQKQKIERVRKAILKELQASPHDSVIFTSSGSEGNNLVFESIRKHFAKEKGHIIVSAVEHPSVRKSAEFLEQEGFDVTYLAPNREGSIEVSAVVKALREDTRLVSIMTVNNETGARFPIEEIAALLKETPTYFHTDAVQAFAQEPLTVEGIDYLTASGHKIYAPKGIGFLYKSKDAPIHALIKGGGQELGFRAGTENVPYILGLEKAIQIVVNNRDDLVQIYEELREYLVSKLTQKGIAFEINGLPNPKNPHICNLWIKGRKATQTLIFNDLKDVSVSAGSACSAGSVQISPVLSSMYPNESSRLEESIRLSFGMGSTKEDIDAFVDALW
ncbi:cysteine desulfurase family protein [uncultured Granulicatella sp.]|uniref:cysteine desulfurase family protein n=1 Tax=uncultured Granulicatella sp. TaxID=316089 RepID=UPI00260B2CB8|nr:cysteine desulfurase family protein [uncultured Granulicatella sp.]